MWNPFRIIHSAYVLALAALLVPALVSDSGVRAEEAGEAFELEDIYVVGSRRPVRSVADAPAPIDTIGGVDFTDQGNTNVPNLMRTLVPSYNVNTQPISDSRPSSVRPTFAGLRPTRRWCSSTANGVTVPPSSRGSGTACPRARRARTSR